MKITPPCLEISFKSILASVLLVVCSAPLNSLQAQPYHTEQGVLTKINGVWHIQANGGADKVDTTSIALKARLGSLEQNMLNATSNLGLTRTDTTSTGWDFFSIPISVSFKTVYEGLVANSSLLEISINVYRNKLWTPNDVHYNAQWYLQRIKADKAWDTEKGCNNIVIAIIDDGIDLNHEDLGDGTDGYQNIFINPNEIPNNNTDDDNNGKEDDWRGWDFEDDDNDPTPNSGNSHGTHVAGIASAKTNNNNTGIAGVAGGNNSQGVQLLPLKVDFGTDPQNIIKAIQYATLMNVDVINMSFGGASTSSPAERSAIQAAYNDGIILVAGSGSSGTNSVWYPAALKEVIAVGASNQMDQRLSTSNFDDAVLAVSAPGEAIWSTLPGNQYGNSNGTSMATPMVAGTAALMKCANPCLSNSQVDNILRETSVRTGGFSYGHVNFTTFGNPPYDDVSEELGHGRLDAEKAVEVANSMNSSSVDLYIKDRFEDFGYPNSYVWGWYFDNSPDIWLRNKRDLNNRYGHQSPDLNLGESYIYIIVRNKSCVDFPGTGSGNAKLHVYWSDASTLSGWPSSWDGTLPSEGNQIGTGFNIPAVPAGENRVIEVFWDFSNESFVQNQNVCLLARLENIPDEGITVYNGQLHKDVYENGNIAMKNLKPVKNKRGFFSDREVPPGGSIVIRNINDDISHEYNLQLEETYWNGVAANLFQEAEVSLHINQDFWDVANQSPNLNFEEVDVIDDNTLRFTSSTAAINGLLFNPEQKIETYLSTSFLAEYADSEPANFTLHFGQYDANNANLLGAVHFDIERAPDDGFEADAGPDQTIYSDESTTLLAGSINEPATYNWYDGDSMVYSGTSLAVAPGISSEYKLEVIADSSNFKDYDVVKISVKQRWIKSLSPNPATNSVTVDYDLLPGIASASLVISDFNGTPLHISSVNLSTSSEVLNLNNFTPGLYTVSLMADGILADSRILVIQ